MVDRRILVVAAHPDDEVLGVGATIARHAADGDNVNILILAEGATSRGGDENDVSALSAAAAAAAAVLGANAPRFAGLPDNLMDSLTLLDIVKHVEAVIDEVRPDIVYTHHGGDLNVDHRMTHQAVITACRPLPGSCVSTLYAFETPSSTEWASSATGETFKPTRFVDVTDFMAKKRQALICYEAEMRPFPHARSLEAVDALATLRGSQSGIARAEAFQVILEIDTQH